MSGTKKLNIVIITLSLLLMMVQFQNCARPTSLEASGNSVDSANNSVHLISDYTQSGIQFPTPSVQLNEQSSKVTVGGMCDQGHTGQAFNWTVAISGSVMMAGQGACDHGQFQIPLTNVQGLVCGVVYYLQLTAVWGGSATLTVSKMCEPLAAGVLLDPPANNGQPQTCRLEYRMSGDASDQGLCQAVCFRNDLLMMLEDRPLEQCENLIDQASGR